MKHLYTLIYVLVLGFAQLAIGQTTDKRQIPIDLKEAKVLIIKYNYSDWSIQHIDSTHDQWVTNRYGKDLLYKNYSEALTEAVRTLEKNKIQYGIIESKVNVNASNYKYLFDYKQVIVDNHEAKVANRHLGGFFFFEIASGKKYAPISENKKYIGKLIKRGLRNGA